MYETLKQLQDLKRPIRVAIVGCGSMGLGIALQSRLTPGLRVTVLADKNLEAAKIAAEAIGGKYTVTANPFEVPVDSIIVTDDLFPSLHSGRIDVLVEATNSVGQSAKYCIESLKKGIHVVLMNAEIDLLLGPYLNRVAEEFGVIVTSDAGDQHGVIATMAEEIKMWGFKLVMLGNIKGFLNRYAVYKQMTSEAAKRYLNVVQCVAYTDGTKVNVEMALLANGYGCTPYKRGMAGPALEDVNQVLDIFDFDMYDQNGVVDYILGANPGGGVYIVGCADEPLQRRYLEYYKRGRGPFYLFYRPYHLCHLETPRAIAQAYLYRKKILWPRYGKLTDVFTFAKQDLEEGLIIKHSIGSDEFYGLIDTREKTKNLVPIALLETEEKDGRPILKRNLKKDEPLTFDDVEFPPSYLFDLYQQQEKLLDESRNS